MFRQFFKITILVTIFVILGCKQKTKEQEPSDTSENDQKTLVICSFGGTYQEAQRKAFFKEFEKQTGIAIREVSYSGEYSKIKGMVEMKKVIWDIVDIEHPVFIRGWKEGLFEPMDYTKIDTSELFEEAVHKYGVATIYYSTVMAFNEEQYPDKNSQPESWVDFWDITRFRGPRCLRRSPRYNLEFALLADGVKKDNLYPLDVDRAFDSLNRIKNHVTVWWETGQQPPQLLLDKEVILSSAWSGRIWNARNINKLPLTSIWEGGILEPEWWIIPKGCNNKELAYRFIDFASKAKPQADIAKYFGVGPVNRKAFDLLDESLKRQLPTYLDNRLQQIPVNAEWWATHEKEIMERWNEWLLKP